MKGINYDVIVGDGSGSPITIQDRVRRVTARVFTVEESEITPETRFSQDLGADSLDAVELVMELEKEFNLAIPDEEAEKLNTVSDVSNYLIEKAGK